MKLATATVHGRFQLLHNDHLEYILKAISLCDHLIVGITSYNIRERVKIESAPHRFVSQNNPMTYYERTKMITEALLDEGLNPCSFSFSPFPIETPGLLPDFIPLNFPCFTTICEEWNRKKIQTLEEIGYKVIVLKENPAKEIEGSKIRNLIINNDESWKKIVPRATIKAVEEMHIQERLLTISNSHN